MNQALKQFKAERPEEYQEYHQYVMDILRIRIWMISLVLVSICLVCASYVWIGIAWCIVLFLITGIGKDIYLRLRKHNSNIAKWSPYLFIVNFKFKFLK